MRGQLHSIACTAIVLGMSSAAAGSHAAAPQGDTLCSPDMRLEKEKLAAYMLDKYPVSTAYLSIADQPAPLQSHRALLHWLLEKRAAMPGDAGGNDAKNVDHIALDMKNMLEGKSAQLQPSGKTDPAHYLEAPDVAGAPDAVRCLTADAKPALSGPPASAVLAAAAGAPAAAATAPAAAAASAPAAPPSLFGKFRLRGNPDQLSIDRSDTAAYASVSKATVDLANDSVAGSKTNNVQAYLGYSLLKSTRDENGSTYEIVPYAGLQQNRVINYSGGGNTVTTTRNIDVGVLNNFHFAHAGTEDADDLSIRPDYLADTSTGTRLFSTNFTYTPIRKGRLNDLIRTGYGVSVKPILVGESRNGTYIERGNDTVAAAHQDFIRVGATAGFALTSNRPDIPVDFILTYTGLKAIVGAQSIHYLKAALTYNFNQNIGLVLNYSDGLLPENGDPEKKWNLGIASKF